MKRTFVLSLGCAAFFSTGSFAAGPVAGAPIGIVMGTGTFLVDSTPVTGPIDLANGAELHTTITPSDIHLENGVDLRFATRSTGALYQDRVMLKDGALRLNHFDGYAVQAGGFTIHSDSFDTEAIIRVNAKTIEIASIGGTVSVSDGGAMLTRVAAGTKMAFQNTGNTGINANGQTPQTPAQTGATPAQTGAAPAEKGPMSNKKAILIAAGVCAVGGIVVGSIAAAQGKSPF